MYCTKPLGGDTPWNSWWGVPPGSPNPDPISDQKMSLFHTCFQTWPQGNYVTIT